MLDNYSDDGVKTIDDNEKSPLFDTIIALAIQVIYLRKEHLEQQLETEHIRDLLRPELDNLLYRVNLVRTWVMLKVREFNSFWRQMYQLLDDGIVTAVAIENEATQGVIARIRDHLNE